MPMSKMKSLAAQWLVGDFDYLQENEKFAVNGLRKLEYLMFSPNDYALLALIVIIDLCCHLHVHYVKPQNNNRIK